MQIDKTLDQFLLEESNFITMIKVYQHFPVTRQRLLQEFWDLTNSKIKEELGPEFNTEQEDDIQGKWAKIYIYKEEWLSDGNEYTACPAIQSLSGKVMYGILTNIENKNFDLSIVRNKVKSNDSFKELKSDKWWAVYKYMNLDFTDNNQLTKILPGVRESLINEIASQAVELVRLVQDDLDYSISETKKITH